MKVIINADDFGKDIETNKAIAFCFKENLISNTSIIVNSEYFNDALELAKKENYFSEIGLHLNFLYGKPLTEGIKKYKDFCGENGEFNAKFMKKKFVLFASKNKKKAIATECEAQAKKFIEAGFTLMHFDSHGHSHTRMFVWKSIEQTMKKLGFVSCRTSIYNPNSSFLVKIYKKILNRRIAKHFKTVNWTVFTELHKYPTFDDYAEIMVHPIKIEEVQTKKDYDILLDIAFKWERISFSELFK